MKKLLLLIFAMVLLVTGCGDKSATDTQTNAEGAEKTDVSKNESKDQPKSEDKVQDKKVIAGTVMAAELLDLLDIDAVGVPSTKKGLPKRYEGVAEIGMSMKPDVEKVVSLQPDVR